MQTTGYKAERDDKTKVKRGRSVGKLLPWSQEDGIDAVASVELLQ
jgi:hypothetical protein